MISFAQGITLLEFGLVDPLSLFELQLLRAPVERDQRLGFNTYQPKRYRPPPADEVRALLKKYRGNMAAVARETSRDRNTVRSWCDLYAIDPWRYRHRPKRARTVPGKKLLHARLEETSGDLDALASEFGADRATVIKWMNRHGLNVWNYREGW